MASLLEKKCNVTRPKPGAAQAIVVLTATIKKGVELDTKEIPITVVPWTNEEALAIDINELNYVTVLGSNGSEAQVISNLTLPTKGKMGAIITWTSNNTTIISETGLVTRPSYSQGDLTIKLSAKIVMGDKEEIKEFSFKVLKKDQTIEEELSSYVKSIEVKNILGLNLSADRITSNLSLSPLGPDGSGISNTWSSSDPLMIDKNGNIFPPSVSEGAKWVTLTLVASKGSKTESKQFAVNVLPV